MIGAIINKQDVYVWELETEDDEENFGVSGSGFRVLFIFCVSL